MVSGFSHKPVLMTEVLAGLAVRPGGNWCDGTCGGAGHSEAILEATAPTGFLWACDQDGDAIRAASERLARFAGRFELRRMNFDGLGSWVRAGSCRGVLLDLGVSSHQLDQPGRGFSFQQDGPLDMRMDDRGPRTAADVVNEWPAEELARIFWEYGDERDSRRIARAIEAERKVRKFATTGQLAACVERVCPRGGRRAHPATRVFQALRMEVNDELGALRRGLAAAMTILEPGGRLAVLTFHSLEDRLVRDFMREESRDYDFDGPVDLPEFRRPRAPRATRITRRAVLPGEAELAENPRSRSAQLRVLEKN